MSEKKKLIVVLSGGQDSTTCLFWAKAACEYDIKAISINYGQRHHRELEAAQIISRIADVPHEIINLPPGILASTSPLVSDAPLEQYPDHQSLPGGLEKTFVPMRNMLFLTLAANRAIAEGANDMVTGVCQEDFGGYPDCRQVFISACEAAIRLGSSIEPDYEFRIHTPLMNLTKAASVKLALELPGCYSALGFSHTSYDGAYPPTGRDHATLLRAKGFEEAGIPDPLSLRAFWEWRMELPETENYQKHRDYLTPLRFEAGTTFRYAEMIKAFREVAGF